MLQILINKNGELGGTSSADCEHQRPQCLSHVVFPPRQHHLAHYLSVRPARAPESLTTVFTAATATEQPAMLAPANYGRMAQLTFFRLPEPHDRPGKSHLFRRHQFRPSHDL